MITFNDLFINITNLNFIYVLKSFINKCDKSLKFT